MLSNSIPTVLLQAVQPSHSLVHCSAAESPWTSYVSFNHGTWHGRASVIDVSSQAMLACDYIHEVKTTAKPLEVSTKTACGGAVALETVVLDSTTDVDLDGSYSASSSFAGASALAILAAARAAAGSDTGPSTPAERFLVEHSIAVSETERRRCMLLYDGQAGDLEQVIMLFERRSAALPPPPPATLDSLVGTWAGDASIRTPKAAAFPPTGKSRGRPARPRGGGGFGGGGDGGRGRGGGGGGGGSSTKLFGMWSTNVFKSELRYASRALWDDNVAVSRRLQVTSFSGDELEPIDSTGSFSADFTAKPAAIRFGGPGAPALWLLPAASHILAPTKISTEMGRFPFSSEFGTMIAPGESFGWMGYRAGDGDDEVDSTQVVSFDGQAPTDAEASRLARVQRLYDEDRSYVSGTTSLLSACK